MAAYITVLNYVYSLCVFYYSVLFCVADAECPLHRLSAIVIKNIIFIIISNIYQHLILNCYSWEIHAVYQDTDVGVGRALKVQSE